MERTVEWRTRPASGVGGAGGNWQEVRNGCGTGVLLRPWAPAEGVVAYFQLSRIPVSDIH